MTRRTCGLALVLLAGLALPAGAQTTLAWKFKEGEKFYVEDVNDLKQTISIIGKDIRQNTKITTITSFVVKSTQGGDVTLDQKIESVDIKSSGDNLGGQMEKVFEKLQGATFTVTLKDGKVTKVKGYDEFIKKLADGDEMAAKFAKMLMSEDTVKKSVQDVFGGLPKQPVNVGDKWSQEDTVPFGPLGAFKSTKDYTFKEKDKDGAIVAYKSTMAYVAPKDKDGVFGGILKIMKGNIKTDNAKGTLVFDVENGKLVRATNSMTAKGALTVEVMGNQLDLDVSVEQATTTRVLAKNPKSD